ncbi:MAG: hypothetical protein KDC44_05490, partial [Phaeodactylibacter sp.]|nr:hypothetical protein [Phaeodactylibacter sp.]
MSFRSRLFFLLIFGLFACACLSAQDTYVHVQKVLIEGNKKTKEKIITRELNIQVGDSIALTELSDRLDFNRLQLMNTGLFANVLVNIKEWNADNEISVNIEVTETWYFYPVPVFELADRNFNVWWVEYNRSLKRINYGLHFYHFNVSGHRDLLDALIQFGFTTKVELEYRLPFINRRQTLGLTSEFLLARNREVNYATEEDKQAFFRSDDAVLLRRLRTGLTLSYRPRLQAYQRLRLRYHRNLIDETVRDALNTDYFLGDVQQRYFSLGYDFVLDQRDIRPYPLNGRFLFFNVRKEGLGIFDDLNGMYTSLEYRHYHSFSDTWSLAGIAKGRAALIRKQQPFYNSQALGYNLDYIRGYEYYVIDGLDYAYTKIDLRWRFFNRPINFGKLMPFEAFRVMPLRLYLVLFNDLGWANNPYYRAENTLPNELLVGYG